MAVLDLSTYKPVPATLADANQIANGMQAVQNVVNAIDNLNFAAGRIFDPAKLMQNAAVDQELMTWDQASVSWKPKAAALLGVAALGLVELFDRVSATTDVASTAAESDLYRKTIVGGRLSTKRSARLTVKGDYLHNNVAADSLTLKLKYGATTLWADTFSLGTVIGAQRHPFCIVIDLENLNATNSQLATIFGLMEIANVAAPTTGEGRFTTGPALLEGLGVAAEDSTADKDIALTATWSASSANNSIRVRGAKLELV